MSKKNKRRQVDPRTLRYSPKARPTEEQLPHFWTQDGRKVRIKTVSIFEVQEAELNIRQDYADKIIVPTYETVTAGGTKKAHDLTEKNLVVEGDEVETARRQADWLQYQNMVKEMEGEISKTSLSIIMDGIDETPEDDTWIPKRKARHLSVPPEDATQDEIILFWKTAVLLRNNIADILAAQNEILVLSTSGIATREEIEAAQATFPDTIPGDGEIQTDSDQGIDTDTGTEEDTPAESLVT